MDFPVISCIVPPSGMGKTFVAHYFPLATASPLAQGHRNTYGQSGIKFQRDESEVFYLWLKAFGITCLAWTSRYLVVNALLIAFTTSGSQLLAFVRQLILWVVMTISPTPGGSGVSEYMFREYYADFLMWQVWLWSLLSFGGLLLIICIC